MAETVYHRAMQSLWKGADSFGWPLRRGSQASGRAARGRRNS